MEESLGKLRHSGQGPSGIGQWQAVVMPTIFYGAESWITYNRHLKALEQYQKQCLQKILRISWKENQMLVF